MTPAAAPRKKRSVSSTKKKPRRAKKTSTGSDSSRTKASPTKAAGKKAASKKSAAPSEAQRSRRRAAPSVIEFDSEGRGVAAYRAIRRLILELELPPGATFTEGELSKRFGLSRTPVREGLAQLRREGLVQVVPKSGYRVTPVTLKGVRDLFAVRMLLEPEACALAARNVGDYEELEELDEMVQASYDPNDPSKVSEFLRLNTDFHVAFARLGGNDRLAAVLRQVLEELERVSHITLTLSSAQAVTHGHRDVLAAVVGGDENEARRVALEELRLSQRRMIESLMHSEEITGANVGAVRRRRAR